MRAAPAPPGVTFLDHTADVGLDVVAPTLEELFLRAAAGMACLIEGGDHPGPAAGAPAGAVPASAGAAAGGPTEERPVALSADDLPALLRAWLRELLHAREVEGRSPRAARFDVLTASRLEAVVELAPEAAGPVREIKGVTLHGLEVERRRGGWAARVIFDV